MPLSDQQIDMLIAAGASLPVEKRGILLERVAAHLILNRQSKLRPTDNDVAAAIALGLQGLRHDHQPAACGEYDRAGCGI